ncbi:cupin domain-containing protein [Salipaludibacillus sp. CF4.18]|uniref:cupin domain-containing protein n=1 Tax=Salipaludibacillus sp. CF4.18 TaxID=3373081 RepID=UPI003EE76670
MAEKNDFFESEEVKSFNKKIKKDDLGPLWSAIPELVSMEPKVTAQPFLWKWDMVKRHLMEATEIFTPDRGGERRAIYFQNPGLKDREPWGWGSTTQNIYAAVQLIQPGEKAPSHRHTQSALRFIISGKGAYSIIQGEKMHMNEGDFLVTPQGLWHGHGHEGDEPMIWMDVLDIPFIFATGGSFFEGHPDGLETPSHPDNYSAQRYEGGMVRPKADRKPMKAPVGSYKWDKTKAALDGLSRFDTDPFDGHTVEFVNPSTGDTANANVASWMQMLPKDYHGKVHRHTNSSIVHVYKGKGYTVINGQKFEWEAGDFFVIPSWSWHEHVNIASEESYLFSVHDTPIMETFNLQREEEGEAQKVISTFEPKD